MHIHEFLDCLMIVLHKKEETEAKKNFKRTLKCKYLNFPLLYILFRILLNYTVLYF